MKVRINDSFIVAGTPDEMVVFLSLAGALDAAEKIEQEEAPERKPEKEPMERKETPKRTPRKKRKAIDWPKAEALKAAGWTQKAIADELGIHEVTVGKHFREQNEAAREVGMI